MKWSSQYFHNNYVLVLSRATPGSLYVFLRLDNAAVASWPEIPEASHCQTQSYKNSI